jgi:regulatory protein
VNAGPQSLLDTGDRQQRALQIAYRYLNRRERTQAEVRRRLASDGVDGPAIEATIANLSEQGLLDDARFARLFIEDKRELEDWGSDRIRRALLERGIERGIVEQALRDDDGDSELTRALALLRRRFPTPPRDRRERDRALGVLLRKGYDSELAVEALGAYARDAEESELR